MTIIVQAASVNTAALGSPKSVVAIQIPSPPITGVQTNKLGYVGVASWGPVGIATVVGGNDEQSAIFGPVTNRNNGIGGHDLSTAVYIAGQIGASSFQNVRVSDGTDTAASGTIAISETFETVTVGGSITNGDSCSVTLTPSVGAPITISANIVAGDTTATVAGKLLASFNASAAIAAGLVANVVGSVLNIYYPSAPVTWTFARTSGSSITLTLGTSTASTVHLTLTALHSGIVGNGLIPILQAGTAAGSAKLVLQRPGFISEVFDNILGTGNLFWQNLASAVNNGNSPLRGPSGRVVATAGVGAIAPTLPITVAMAGGTDGALGVTDATLLGADVAPRTGIYALRGQGCGVACPVDSSTNTYWTDYVAVGEAEGFLTYGATPPGDTITNAASELANAGIDSYAVSIAFGDWIYWYDSVNMTQRLLSPATFLAAARALLSPQNSVLNKGEGDNVSAITYPIIGSQKTLSGGVYSSADIDALYSYRLELLANPVPGGSYWGSPMGVNTSSNAAINGDNYTMMTNFLARSIANWAGTNIGLLQTPTQRINAKAAGDNFFNGLWVLGMIGNADSANGIGTPPWSVAINDQTTPPAQAALGYEICNIMVQYLAVIRWFVVNLMGGQTVTVTVSSTPPAAYSTP